MDHPKLGMEFEVFDLALLKLVLTAAGEFVFCFSLSVYLGYYISKLFHSFINEITKDNTSKNIKLRKRFSTKIIIDFLWKSIKNWLMRIGEKWLLFLEAIDLFIHALKIFRKKFKPSLKPKYIKRNFRLLKFLLSLFWEAVEVFWSLINEILRLKNILRFISNWRQLIILLMAESILITSAVYFLYLIFLVLLGIVLGFWVGVYNREEEIYVFTLLSLLEMLYKNRFNPVLLELWGDLSLEPNRVEYFSKLSLKTVEQIHPRPSKLIK